LLSGFAGMALGQIGSVVTTLVRSPAEQRRERAPLAIEAAIEAQRGQVEDLKASERTGVVPPLSAYIYYHSKVIDLLDSGELTADTLRKPRRTASPATT